MSWFVCRKIGLFSANLERVSVILLDFTQNNVSVYLRVSYAVFSNTFAKRASSFFFVPKLDV